MTEQHAPRRVVAFVGNCQAFSLMELYRRHIAPALGEEAIHVQITPGLSAQDIGAQREHLLRADVIVEQKFDAADLIPADILARPGLRRHRFPYLSGRLYWPYGGGEHAGAQAEQPLDGGRAYPPDLRDAWLNRMISERVPTDEALRRYDAVVAESAARIARLAELHLERQRDRDAACGMNFSEFIAENYQREKLFTTQGHPGLVLSRMLISAVFDAIGVPGILVRETLASLFTAPFPASEMPIHPGVADILGLRFVAPEQRYRFMDEGFFTFREFAARYLSHTLCADMPAAQYLLRIEDFEVGIPLMQQALQQCTGTSTVWQMLAQALMRVDRLAEAEAAIRQAVLVGPPHPDVFALQAEILIQCDQPEAAEQAVLAATELLPEHAGAQHAQANLMARQGRHAEAVAITRLVAARQPGDAGALWVYAYHLRLAGLPEQAEPVLRQVLELDPTNAGARTALDELAMAAAPPVVRAVWVAEPPLVRLQPIGLDELSNHPGLRIDGGPVALRFDNLPKRGVAVPPLAYGATGGLADAFVEVHAAAPAWLLRNVTVHGMCGLVSTAGYAIAETLDPARLRLMPGAALDPQGWVLLPERAPLGNIHSAFHLLDFRGDDVAHWLLDRCARFGAEAVRALLSHEGASRAPIVLLPPLDRFWKWEGVDLVVPDTTARLALLAEGDLFVQRLLFVPGLSGDGWATHPATGPLFDAVRDRIAGRATPSGGGRRIFIDGPEAAAPGNHPQLAALAEAAGFARVSLGELPLWHLVRLFAEASHVIGAHGPDLAGTVFCRPGTAVCELRPDSATPWTWRHLAAVRGLRYGCLEGSVIEPEAFQRLLRDEGFAS